MAVMDSDPMYDDQGNTVIAVNYTFIIVTLLVVVTRIGIALLRKRAFALDDILLVLAVPLGLLSAICTGNAAINGLGRSIAMVHSGQLSNYFKLSYTSQIFMILAMAASKHSVVALMDRVTPHNSPKRRYIRFIHPVIGSWMLFSIFGLAFQCGTPAPWIYQPSRCSGSGAIWYPVVIISIMIDIGLAFGYVPATKDMQLDPKRNNIVSSLFLARLIVPVLSIAYLAVIAPALLNDDQTAAMAVPSIMAQIAMNLSIMTAAIPVFSRTLISLESSPSTAIVSEITALPLDQSNGRGTSDENNRLRDWAFAQLRNSPTPNSLIKDISIGDSPRKPERAQLPLERVDTAPAIPPRSEKRSPSPRLTLNFDNLSPNLDVKEAWFVDSKRTSAQTTSTIENAKRVSQGI